MGSDRTSLGQSFGIISKVSVLRFLFLFLDFFPVQWGWGWGWGSRNGEVLLPCTHYITLHHHPRVEYRKSLFPLLSSLSFPVLLFSSLLFRFLSPPILPYHSLSSPLLSFLSLSLLPFRVCHVSRPMRACEKREMRNERGEMPNEK